MPAKTDTNVMERLFRAMSPANPANPDGPWVQNQTIVNGSGGAIPIDAASGALQFYNVRGVQGESTAFQRLFTGLPWSYTQLSGSFVSGAIGAAGNRILHSIFVDVTTTGSQSTGIIFDNTASGGNILWQGNFASLGNFPTGHVRDSLAQNGLYMVITGTMAGLIGGILWL